jgi:hypothetical protein
MQGTDDTLVENEDEEVEEGGRDEENEQRHERPRDGCRTSGGTGLVVKST